MDMACLGWARLKQNQLVDTQAHIGAAELADIQLQQEFVHLHANNTGNHRSGGGNSRNDVT